MGGQTEIVKELKVPTVCRPRRRFSPEQIRSYLESYQRSEQSAAAFAREHDLAPSVLMRWIHRQSQPPKRRGRPPKLREVALGSVLGAGVWAAEVVRPDGLTVRVAADAPARWLDLLLGRLC